MTYFTGLHKRNGRRYGRSMNITSVLPGIVPLVYHTPSLSREAKVRLAWMDHYRKEGNARKTCRHFGISPKVFYYWKNRYKPFDLTSLENKDKKPKHARNWEVTRIQEFRILHIRRLHMRYGKMKLRVIYEKTYGEKISSWAIQRVIEKHKLYPPKKKPARGKKKTPKNRIINLEKQAKTGFLVALDTVVIYFAGMKRYIFTAIDTHSKIAYARMYTSKSSKNAADFLKRVYYLMDCNIVNLTRDNGSEFAGMFDEALSALQIQGWYSRVATPKDNPVDERFNRTLQEEFIGNGNLTADCELFNQRLATWLEEYNFERPHQTLSYMVPVEYHYRYSNHSKEVLPMYSSSTGG